MKTIFGIVLGVLVIAVISVNAPDIARYLKISSM
jgi:hypothetical protein